MKKTYTFEFSGSKAQFLNQLKQYPNAGRKFYYLNDYIIDLSEEDIRFGVARAGHSGGYWFLPTVTEAEGKTVFRGEIQYDDPKVSKNGFSKVVETIGNFLAFLFFLPLIAGFNLYRLVRWVVLKIRKQPMQKEPSPEDRLMHLMQTHLHCVYRDSSPQ